MPRYACLSILLWFCSFTCRHHNFLFVNLSLRFVTIYSRNAKPTWWSSLIQYTKSSSEVTRNTHFGPEVSEISYCILKWWIKLAERPFMMIIFRQDSSVHAVCRRRARLKASGSRPENTGLVLRPQIKHFPTEPTHHCGDDGGGDDDNVALVRLNWRH